MLPCKVWVADPTGPFLGDGAYEAAYVVSFEGAAAIVVTISGRLRRISIDEVVVDVKAMLEQGLGSLQPPPKSSGTASKRSEWPPKTIVPG